MARAFTLWFGHIIAGIVSILAAFFGVYQVLFSDIFGTDQRIGATVYVVILYAIVGFFLTLAWPLRSRQWMIWLSVPAALAVVIITATELERVLLHLLTLGAALAGAWLGIWAGKQIRKGKGPAIPPPVPPMTS